MNRRDYIKKSGLTIAGIGLSGVMKPFILFITGFLTVFMIACQSEFSSNLDFEISINDAVKELSHTPTGVVYVETAGQQVKIDFSYYINEKFITDTFTIYLENSGEIFYGNIYSIPNLGELTEIYKAYRPLFLYGYSNYMPYPSGGNFVLPRLDYILAQECFQDDCSTQTRKAVLQMAVDKQKHIYIDEYLNNGNAVWLNIFLMAVILVKENDVAFLAAVKNNPDIQKALCLNSDLIILDRKLSDFMKQSAIRFLSNN